MNADTVFRPLCAFFLFVSLGFFVTFYTEVWIEITRTPRFKGNYCDKLQLESYKRSLTKEHLQIINTIKGRDSAEVRNVCKVSSS